MKEEELKSKGHILIPDSKENSYLTIVGVNINANKEANLEIPGYSSYLHPYDETHIIGIGQDVEIEDTKYGEINEENRTYSIEINRGLYIKDCLYTLSNKKIEIMKLNIFNKISEIELE